VSPVPEAFSDASEEKPVYIFGIVFPMRMHHLADDFIVEEGGIPASSDSGKVRKRSEAES
jgi:hypothetical protein